MAKHERNEQVIRKFKEASLRAKKTFLILGCVGMLIYFYLYVNFEELFKEFSPEIMAMWAGVGVGMSFVVLGLIVSWLFLRAILRCPACSVSWGVANPNFCPSCGVPLQ